MSLVVAAGMTSEQIARLEVDRQNAGHLFTVDLVGSASRLRNTNVGAFGGTDSYPRYIGVEFSFPLYQGWLVDSRIRESAANLGRAQSETDEARRQALLDARQAMLGVGYAFGWGDLTAAWRHLDYDMKPGKAIESISFDGPGIAATFRW